MYQNKDFVFTDQKNSPNSGDFKNQRKKYLEQRKARKMVAKKIIKKQFQSSQSSENQGINGQIKQKNVVYADPNPVFPRTKTGSDHNFKILKDNSFQNLKQFKDDNNLHKMIKEKKFHQEADQGTGSASSDQHYMDQLTFSQRNVDQNQGFYIRKRQTTMYEKKKEKQPAVNIDTKQDKNLLASNLKVVENFQHLKKSWDSRSKTKIMNSLDQSANLFNSTKLYTKQTVQNQPLIQIQIPSKKINNIFLKKTLKFTQNSIILAEKQYLISEITKIKMIFQQIPKNYWKIRFTYLQEDIVFAVDKSKIRDGLDLYYYVFSRIINLKLLSFGSKKVQINLQIPKEQQLSWMKIDGMKISGKIRKSSFFGTWQDKYAVITNESLTIYKKGKIVNEKPIIQIPKGTLKELYTRFQLQNNSNLLIKFLHFSTKMEFSIQVSNFSNKNNWLYHIYCLADLSDS